AQPVADNAKHRLTITGANFSTAATVNLYDLTDGVTYPNRPVIAPRSSTVLTLNPNFGSTAAKWRVEVVNPDGKRATFDFNVSVVASPSITSVSPNPVPANASPQTLTINGANFQIGGTVTLVDVTTGDTFTVGPLAH